MGKIVRPLTAIQVKNAKPKEKTYRMFDGGCSIWKSLRQVPSFEE